MRNVINLIFASFVTLVFYLLSSPYDRPFADDAGIILRYLDNFRRGLFYTYDRIDGPVYGISGFWHGILAGSLAFSGLPSETALVFANALGCFLFFLALTIFYQDCYRNQVVALLCTSITVVGAEYLLVNSFLGLETLLNLATTVLIFISFNRNSRFFFLCCVTALISKLDNGPVVSVFLIFYFLKSPSLSTLRNFAIYFFFPLCLWIGTATLLFGSPLPQTFIAKNAVAIRPKGFFPFAYPFVFDWKHTAVSFFFLILGFFLFVRSLWQRNFQIQSAIATAALAVLLEYYFFNPIEAMRWYYALPEFLFLTSGLTLPALYSPTPRNYLLAGLAIFALLRIPDTQARLLDSQEWNFCAETERIEVGKKAAALTSPEGLTLTSHGHIARYAPGRVIDFGGLNSKQATQPKTLVQLMSEYPPDTIVIHGLLTRELQRKHSLSLTTSSYGPTEIAGAWRTFTRKASPKISFAIFPATQKTSRARFDLKEKNISEFGFGVVQQAESLDVKIKGYQKEKLISDTNCAVPKSTALDCGNFRNASCVVNFAPREKVDFVEVSSSREIKILEPYAATE